MDSNADGMVDFHEFVAATLHVHQLEQANTTKWQHQSKAAFSKFDVDGDSYITTNELKIVSTQTSVPYSLLWTLNRSPRFGYISSIMYSYSLFLILPTCCQICKQDNQLSRATGFTPLYIWSRLG